MRDELVVHRGMAAEALEMLPPFPGRVWWTTRVADLPSVGGEFELPQFHRVSTDMPSAFDAPLGGEGVLNVVWSVDRSSARDISPVARVAGERVVLYPAATRFRVASVSRGRRYDESTGRYFVHVTLAEVAPQGSERRGSEREWDPEILTVPARTGDGRDVGVMSFDARSGRVMRDVLAGLTDVTHGGGFTMMVQGGPHGFEVVSRFGPRLVSGRDWGAYLGNLLAERGLPAGTRIYAVERTSAVLGQAVADASGHGFTAPVRIDGAVGAPRLLVADFEPRDRPVTAVTLRETHRAHVPYAGQFIRFYQYRQWSDLSWEYERGLGAILAADPEVLGAARHMLETLLPEGARAPEVDGADLTRLMAAVNMAAVSGGLIAVRQPRLLDRGSPRYRSLRSQRGFLLAELRSSIGRDLLEAYGERVPADRLPPARRAVVGWLLSTGEDSLYEVLSDTHGVAGGSPAERAVLLGDAAHLYAWAHAEFAVGTRLRTPYQTLYETRHHQLTVLASDIVREAKEGQGEKTRRRRDAVRDWIRRIPGRIVTLSRGSGTQGEGSSDSGGDALPSAQDGGTAPAGENVGRHPEVVSDEPQPRDVPSSPLDSLTDGHMTALYLFAHGPDRQLLAAVLDGRSRHLSQREILQQAGIASIVNAFDSLQAGGRAAFPVLLMRDERLGPLIRQALSAPSSEPRRRRRFDELMPWMRLRFRQMSDRLLGQIPEHVGMAAEALRLLPPINSSMWFAFMTPHADVDSFRVPAFSKGGGHRRDAMASLSELGALPGHRLLVEVVNSSARDVSFLSAIPGRTTAMYPDRGMELMIRQRGWRHDADGNRYEYVQVTEVEPIGQFPVPVVGMPRDAVVDVADGRGGDSTTPVGEATLGAEEMPSREHWNAPAPAHDSEAPPARFPDYFADQAWPELSETYERTFGQVLAADPAVARVIRRAIDALSKQLSYRFALKRGEMFDAFHVPSPGDRRTAFEVLNATHSVPELMEAFANAAYAHPTSPWTLKKLWSARPELNTLGLPVEPEAEPPHSADWYEQMRDRRGYPVRGTSAKRAEWLLGVYRQLDTTDSPVVFRRALLAWQLASGEHSLVELLQASHRAGVREQVDPDPLDMDASQLYGWVDAMFAPQDLIREGKAKPADPEAALRALRQPHRTFYARRMAWLDTRTPEHGRVRGAVAWSLEIGDQPRRATPDLAAWRDAQHDWLLRHRVGLLRNLDGAHTAALYLMGGPDRLLLDAWLTSDPVPAVPRLRQQARALVDDAFARGDLDGGLPLLFLRDSAFGALAARARALLTHQGRDGAASQLVKVRGDLSDLAARLADGLHSEIPEHREMVAEAVELLPPVADRVWWATWERGSLDLGEFARARQGPLVLERLHEATTSRDQALESEADRHDSSADGFMVLWEVSNSSGRDVSLLARHPQERLVLYPERTAVRITDVSGGYDTRTNRPFVRVVAEETVLQLDPLAWNRPIISHDVSDQVTGTWMGAISFDSGDVRRLGDLSVLRDRAPYGFVAEGSESPTAESQTVPWGENVAFFFAHANPNYFTVPSRYGGKRASKAEVGRYLRALLEARGVPRDWELALLSCQSGADVAGGVTGGQVVADWTGNPTHAPTATLLRLGDDSALTLALEHTPGRPRPHWVRSEPRDRAAVAAATHREQLAGGQAARFRAFYREPRWRALSAQYERALGHTLAMDPAVISVARQTVRQLREELAAAGTPDVAMRFFAPHHPATVNVTEVLDDLLDEDGGATLDDLMTAVSHAALGDEDLRENERFDTYHDLWHQAYDERGIPNGRVEDLLTRRLLEEHQHLGLPAADTLKFREAVLGWLLSGGYNSLHGILTESHGLGLGDDAERAAAAGDAAHLYAWADATLRPSERVSSPGLSARPLPLPQHHHYVQLVEGWRAGTPNGLAAAMKAASDRNMPPGHGIALHLIGGPDSALLSERFTDPVQGRSRLRAQVRALTTALSADGRSRRYPLLFLRDPHFRLLATQAGTLNPGLPGELRWLEDVQKRIALRAEQLSADLLTEIPEHLGMAGEALAGLPPAGTPVWWTLSVPENSLDSLSKLTVPPLHPVTLDEQRALADLDAHTDTPGEQRVLVRAEGSTARNISAFSDDPDRHPGLFPSTAELTVLARESRTDSQGNPYLSLRVVETGLDGTQEPVFTEEELAEGDADESVSDVPPDVLGADELPDERSWNAPRGGAPADPLPPRFAGMYRDRRWKVISGEYERALGELLAGATDLARVARNAVESLHRKLYNVHGPQAAEAFAPGDVSEAGAVMQHLLSGNASVRELVHAFAHATYDSPSTYKLTKLWAARPDLKTPGLSLRPRRQQPWDKNEQWFRDVHEGRGFPMTTGPAEQVEFLLRVYEWLDIPGGGVLLFRDALMAWLLPGGTQSVAEILQASHRAGVRDETEPLAEDQGVDAARAYAWIDSMIVTSDRLAGLRKVRDSGEAWASTLMDHLVLPYRRLYAEWTWWMTADVTYDGAALWSIVSLAALPGSVVGYPQFGAASPTSAAEVTRGWRMQAWRAWSLRHRNHRLLRNLSVEHVPALYLASGSDAPLLSLGESASPELLRR
ncbi:hypothetical protein, partial [Streptomyces sp. NPDC060022]|uniref:hypothetical protein n=1 Tax=Streptomyces sp. NPDC060022 TaxID=3347039 RepID=UPI00369136BE